MFVNASQRKKALIGLLALAVVAITAAVILFLTNSTPLTAGPLHALPRASTVAVVATTNPTVEQKLQIAKLTSSTTPNITTTQTMLNTVLPPTQNSLPFAGPRTAWSWIPPSINTAEATPVVALEITDVDAARQWAEKNCPPKETIYDIVKIDDVDVLRIAKTTDTTILSGPTFDTDMPALFAQMNNSALAAGWADLSALASTSAAAAPALQNLYSWFVLGTNTTGQIQANLTVDGGLVAIDGTGTDVNLNGIPAQAPNADLHNRLANLPDTSVAAFAATDVARLAKNVDLVEANAPNLADPASLLGAAGPDVGVALGPALPGTTRPIGWVSKTGSEQQSLGVATALFGDSSDWTVTPGSANMVVVANTSQWAGRLAVPVAGQTLQNVDKFDQLLPDIRNASAAALFNTSTATTGLWSSTDRVGLTVATQSGSETSFKLRALLRTK